MADTFPNALAMREVKYSPKVTTEERVALARRLLQEGRTAEALDLFMIAKDAKGIAEMRALAVKDGRPLLLLSLRRVGIEPSPEEWKNAGEAAFRAERWREAFRAFSAAADEAGIARVLEKLPGYALFQPQGK